jgi:DNA replication and repair protein RecF
MVISSLRVVGFRNLADAEVDAAKNVFLVGENGQGKTNFLEAVYFCSYASSFRGVNDKELVKNGEKSCSVQTQFADSLYEKVVVKLESPRQGGPKTGPKAGLSAIRKTVVIDGKKVDDRKELLSVVPCIVFCHEDMAFASGPPEDRRWFFDQSLSLYDPVYLDDLRSYRKILKMRNAVLKDSPDKAAMLDALDPQLASYGVSLVKARAEAARLFSEAFVPLYEQVSGISGVSVQYMPSWKETEKEPAVSFLRERREGDCAFGATLSGPHRDRYVFTCGSAEFARNASTGQRRLLALLLRVAQARRFSAMTGKKPVLLLDDVLLELDPEKRRRFLEVLPEYDQAFYTFLPEEPYERYQKDDTLVYQVKDGVLAGPHG